MLPERTCRSRKLPCPHASGSGSHALNIAPTGGATLVISDSVFYNSGGSGINVRPTGGDNPPRLLEVKRTLSHPQFNVQAILAHRASADVALVQLAAPLRRSKTSALLGRPTIPIEIGARFTIAGVGVTKRGEGKTGGTIRAAGLAVTGKPGTLQIRLADPLTNNLREGLGACTGDSGAPVFEMQAGQAVITGVVSWSTGANNTEGCGGLTGVTPLILYLDWIRTTAAQVGSPL